jgi:hypothetical protein
LAGVVTARVHVMAIGGCTSLFPKSKTHDQFQFFFFYLFNKDNTNADEQRKDDKEGKITSLFLVTDFVSNIEQLPESDDGDVHDVVTG